MKILTWNLAGGDKQAATAALGADILMLQERRRGDVCEGEHWTGTLHTKGLSVRGCESARVTPIRTTDALPRYFVPYEIEGPEPFQLINIWAMNDGADIRYVRGIHRALDLWETRIVERPTVMAGDFNASSFWDHEHPANLCFSALARRLSDLGLVSAYHTFHGEEFGEETRPTFFLYRHADKAYHLDYCFIPRAWLPRLRSVDVGRHDEWGRFSDHMPVTVEIA